MSRAGLKVSPVYLLCIEKNRKLAFIVISNYTAAKDLNLFRKYT